MNKIYDCLIIGAGPAGISCSLYLKRANKDILVFEKDTPGGKVVKLHEISNYPGYSKIEGSTLAFNMYQQTVDNNINIVFEEVTSIKYEDHIYKVTTNQNEYYSKYVVYAGGVSNNKLNVIGEAKYYSKGISYCVTCDGAIYKNRPIVYIYKGLTEVEYEINYLKNLTKDLYLVDLNNESNKVLSFLGDNTLKQVEVIIDNQKQVLNVDAAFINLGFNNTDNLSQIEGIYIIGDANKNNLKQIVVAASDGAVTATEIIKKLK